MECKRKNGIGEHFSSFVVWFKVAFEEVAKDNMMEGGELPQGTRLLLSQD